MMKRRNFLTYSLLFAVGCSSPKLTDATAGEASVKRPENLRLAVTDVQGLATLEADYGPFKQVLEEVLELPIEFFPVENLVAAGPALLASEVDLVFAGPSEYLILRARAEAEPVIAVTRPDYYSVIAVRADSEIQSLTDLKGKTIAMRTEGATAAHIWPTKLLLDAGLKIEDFQTTMLDDDGVNALVAREVDAWADSNSRHARFVEAAGATEQVRIIVEGASLPNDIFVARSTLDPLFIQDLQKRMVDNQTKLLEAMASTPANGKYQLSTFISAADDQYDELRAVYQAIGQEAVIQ
ncbi:MAG: PhnD/SsuA/transferrin family substrate-binding protein [Leptolyngbya sp. SIOISBB]|nr:PhnD/SsuA/transferrin family substrate-binding protein [Leptolyngbya sp. SIOISBB]